MRVKICGITTEADGVLAAELGADAVGLNFFASSPRYVDPARAAAILQALLPFVEPVGLVVNQPLREAVGVLAGLGGIHTLQWHVDAPKPGDADPYRLITAWPVQDAHDLQALRRYLDDCRAAGRLPAAVLVDARVPGLYGGTGRQAPWELLAELSLGVPLILAGGLTPDNVAEAIRLVRPYAVDVAGGVEAAPGRKDPEKMRRFIAAAREAAVLVNADSV